jgi:hypothetical protein
MADKTEEGGRTQKSQMTTEVATSLLKIYEGAEGWETSIDSAGYGETKSKVIVLLTSWKAGNPAVAEMKDRKLEEYARTIEGSVKHFQTKNSLVLAGTEDEEEKQDDFSEDKTSYIDMLSVKGSSGNAKTPAEEALREALAGAARARMEFYDAKAKASTSAALILSHKLDEPKPKSKSTPSKPAKGSRASGPSSVGQDDEEDELYDTDDSSAPPRKASSGSGKKRRRTRNPGYGGLDFAALLGGALGGGGSGGSGASDPSTLLKLKEAESKNLELQIELAKLKK